MKIKIIVCVMMLFLSCNVNTIYNDRKEDKAEGEQVTNEFYMLLRKRVYAQTYHLFSHKFFTVTLTDTTQLYNMLDSVDEKLGSIDSVNLESWHTVIITGTNPIFKYSFVYNVIRSKFPSKETISLVKENGEIKILGFHISSLGFKN